MFGKIFNGKENEKGKEEVKENGIGNEKKFCLVWHKKEESKGKKTLFDMDF